MLISIITLSLSLVAGFGLFVLVANRLLGYLRDGGRKKTLLVLLFLGAVVVFLVVGLLLLAIDVPQLILLPLILILFAELRLRWVRKRYQAAPPVDVQGYRGNINRPITTTDLQVIRYEIKDNKLPMDHLRVVHLSDFHLNDTIPASYYFDVISKANQVRPDLIFITGDFVTERKFIPLLPDLLSKLDPRLGVYAILGNHDYWTDPSWVTETLDSLGITVLEDQHYKLEGESGQYITITGCERPWGGGICEPEKGLDDYVLALSHSGDFIFPLSEGGVSAVFSGHYHAGQFRIPGFGPVLLPSKYGRLFAQGHFLVNGTHLFVSAGVGAGGPPIRIYCPPDFFVVDFS